MARISPIGKTHEQAMRRRSRRPAYRETVAKLAPYEHLARLVIYRRVKEGWTQAELAERLGTSHSVISRIESGQYPTSVTTLERLAEAFDTNLVLGFADDPSALAKARGVTAEQVPDSRLVAVS